MMKKDKKRDSNPGAPNHPVPQTHRHENGGKVLAVSAAQWVGSTHTSCTLADFRTTSKESPESFTKSK